MYLEELEGLKLPRSGLLEPAVPLDRLSSLLYILIDTDCR